MATITAYTALDMTDTSTWPGDVLSASSSKIVISDGFYKGIYTGSFEYGGGEVTGGTLKGYIFLLAALSNIRYRDLFPQRLQPT